MPANRHDHRLRQANEWPSRGAVDGCDALWAARKRDVSCGPGQEREGGAAPASGGAARSPAEMAKIVPEMARKRAPVVHGAMRVK